MIIELLVGAAALGLFGRKLDPKRGVKRSKLTMVAIRADARHVMKDRSRKCSHCSFTKALEIAHKKAVRLFDQNATLAEINHPNNLMYLCPNCHTVFDRR